VTKTLDPDTAQAPTGNRAATTMTQMIVVSWRPVNGPQVLVSGIPEVFGARRARLESL
jgi:hypothetical protein